MLENLNLLWGLLLTKLELLLLMLWLGLGLEELEAVGGWNWEKAEVTVEVFFGDTLEKETSSKGERESSVILFQKFSSS